MTGRFPRRWVDSLSLLFGLLLFWPFARQIDLAQGLLLLGRIGAAPFLLYLAVNIAIALLFANRWWLLLRGLGARLAYGRVAVYRLIAATVSLLTPGPQFGGEPAQIYLLVRNSQVAGPQAIASVALDRTLELAVNLAFLAAGILYSLWSGVLGPALDGRVILLALLPLAAPLILLLSFWWQGRFLASLAGAMISRLPVGWQARSGPPLAALGAGEAHIHAILRRNPQLVGSGLLVTGFNWLVLLADFWLATRLVGLELDFAQYVGFVVAARIAILLPIPAGLGALEASQVLAAQLLGLPATAGLALVLLFRFRDLALILWGLGLAWREGRQIRQPA